MKLFALFIQFILITSLVGLLLIEFHVGILILLMTTLVSFVLTLTLNPIRRKSFKSKIKTSNKQKLDNKKLLQLLDSNETVENKLLVPLDIFDKNEIVIDNQEQAQYKASIIINTLKKFKLDADFETFSANASITTLFFKPKDYIDENGKVFNFDSTKIENIIENIKLNLGTNSVSFIPIVEGQSLFAFEIKSTSKNVIRIGNILPNLKSDPFELNYIVGQKTDGQWLTTNIVTHPHSLIVGATNSGKSTFANSMLSQLVATKKPNELEFWISDNKVVEFISFEDLPHTKYFAKDYDETLKMLNALIDIERHRSGHLFTAKRAKNIISYNKKVDPSERLPFIVVLIDEFPTLVETDNKTRGKPFMASLNILLSKARAAGIYIHILSQNAKATIIDTTLRGNLQCRIVLSVADANDSQTAGVKGADLLNGFGDLIFKLNQFQERCQAPFISDDEIDKITDYIKDNY